MLLYSVQGNTDVISYWDAAWQHYMYVEKAQHYLHQKCSFPCGIWTPQLTRLTLLSHSQNTMVYNAFSWARGPSIVLISKGSLQTHLRYGFLGLSESNQHLDRFSHFFIEFSRASYTDHDTSCVAVVLI